MLPCEVFMGQVPASLRSRRTHVYRGGDSEEEDGRECLPQKPLLLHLHLLFYGNWINRAASSMTNQNKVTLFCMTDFRWEGVKKYS